MSIKQELEQVLQQYDTPPTYEEVARKLDLPIKLVRNRASRYGLTGSFYKLPNHHGIIEKEAHQTQELTMRDASKQEQSRIERLLENNGYRPQWSVSWVHLMDGDTKTTTLLRNPQEAQQEEEWREEFLAKIKKQSPRRSPPKRKKVTDGHLHLIDIADLHIGKSAFSHDGTPLYDIEKAVSIAHKAVESLVTYGQGYNVEQFILPIGNDVLHIDSKLSATTSGTPQQSDKMWTHMVEAAFDMYVTLAEQLSTIAPVKLVHCRDNHGEHLSYMLARMVEAQLHRNKWVEADISRLDRMYHQYGVNLLGFDHGHGVKSAQLPQVVAAEASTMWGQTRNRYFYRHHLHHGDFKNKRVKVLDEEVLKDYPGLTVQYMRAPCPPDDWHHNAGYIGAPKAVDSFILHPERGQLAHLSCPVA